MMKIEELVTDSQWVSSQFQAVLSRILSAD
jgi:hypothetical protein